MRHNLFGGCPAIRPITLVDTTAVRFKNGAEVHGYEPSAHFDSAHIDRLDRFAQFAVLAAREAVANSAISGFGERAAIVTGTSVGGMASQDSSFADLYAQGRTRVNPFTIPRTMSNAGASHISAEFGITGPAFTISTACSSATHAIGHAFWMVRSGQVEFALAGGAEAPFSFGMLKAWEGLRVISPDTCRPFSKNRRGLILAEGAAIIVLEPLQAAQARGARIYGEIIGFGMSSDAGHLTNLCVEGPARAMRSALQDAGIQPEAIGYINAHGTGTHVNDPTETLAIRHVFGSHADRLPVSSTKSMHGHALGAAGALETVATALALSEGILPPTANYDVPDPQCDLDVIPNQSRACPVEYALSNSFAFGGLNAVLAFRAPRR